MREYQKSIILFAILILTYLIRYDLSVFIHYTGFSFYIVNAFLWLVVARISLNFLMAEKKIFLMDSMPLIKLSFIAGILYSIIYFLSGFIYGFGKSPYDLSLKGVIFNLIFISSTLIGYEFSRAYLVNKISKKYFIGALVLTALLYTFFDLSPGLLFAERKPYEWVVFVASKPLPIFSEHLLSSFLVFLGGPFSSLAFRSMLKAFEWCFPLLPNPSWAFKSFFSVVFCVTTMLILAALNQKKLPLEDKHEVSFSDAAGWFIVGVLAVVLVWFFAGVFAYKPVLVAGKSMEPAIRFGDIAIYTHTSPTELKEGDIIVFYKERGRIIHRIVRIESKNGKLLYFTKGDANRVIDADPVSEEQVAGKVVFIIPRLGWISIALKNLINTVF